LQLPEKFIERIKFDLKEEADQFFNSLGWDIPVSIRINPDKGYETEGLEKIPWCETGYYLNQRPVFTLDPLFHAGTYYVQEASSMFLEQVIKQTINTNQPVKVLDLCAAPGGKTTHLISMLSSDSLIVSNEVIRHRSKILSENVIKWGNPNVIVTNNDPSSFQKIKGFFDIFIVDAPCSGEGLFRKDSEAANEWSEDNINLCSARQKRIINDAWDALKPGGIVIYSTCTYNEQENEENIKWMTEEMGAEPIEINIDAFSQLTQSPDKTGLHFYPHRVKGEGFFISALQKTDGHPSKQGKIKKSMVSRLSSSVQKEIAPWIINPAEIDLMSFQDKVLAFPSTLTDDILYLIDNLNIINCGTEVCEIKGKDLIPSHDLSVSSIVNKSNFTVEDLDLQTAIKFLRKEEIKPEGKSKYLLAQYKNQPIGWLKNAGNRYNNLYPKEWRIRMDANI
jgi:NOL1/NOP2/sun family putative RNA methylase